MSNTAKVREVPTVKREAYPSVETAASRRMYEPFAEMERMFENMMQRHFGRSLMQPFAASMPFRSEPEMAWPRIDVIDRNEELMIRAEIPGVAKDDLEISITGNRLTLRGHSKRDKKGEEGEYYYAETSRGEFCRTMTLPTEVYGSKANATYKNGVVELTLPKVAAAKTQRIEIKTK